MSQISYQVIRSRRKTISIQVTPEGQVVVRCPLRLSSAAIQAFVASKEAWIRKHLQEREQFRMQMFTEEEIKVFTQKAKEMIPQRVAFYAPIVGVDYGRITIRHQRTRWGSCSSKGNLNFNCLLMAVPPEVADYVVVHELCHLKEMNHAKAFWTEVEHVIPDYKTYRKWLKDHAAALIGRMR